MGGSNLTGALADFLAAIDGSNLGGGNTAPALVDRQVTGWLRDLMGFPPGSGGTLTSGGSSANLIGHAVMRHAKSGVDFRRRGVRAMARPLRVYASDQVHSCHQKALEVQARGMAGAEFLFDYGIDLSRSFKALKVWMAQKEFGPARHGQQIAQSIACAAHLAQAVAAANDMELMAPQVINITCFRFNPGGLGEAALKALNTEIMLRLQEEGIAVPTDTTLDGRHSLRVATVNHRTTLADMDVLLAETRRIGRSLLPG